MVTCKYAKFTHLLPLYLSNWKNHLGYLPANILCGFSAWKRVFPKKIKNAIQLDPSYIIVELSKSVQDTKLASQHRQRF